MAYHCPFGCSGNNLTWPEALGTAAIMLAVGAFAVISYYYIRKFCCRNRNRQTSRSVTALDLPPSNYTAYTDIGLDQQSFAALPGFVYSARNNSEGGDAEENKPECYICLMEFTSGEVVKMLPRCSHKFHEDCIGMWLRSHNTCPYCRTSVINAPAGVTTAAATSQVLPV